MANLLKIHTNISLNDDISAETGIDGNHGWIRVHNGFNITPGGIRTNIGRAVFDVNFDIETTTDHSDNSITYSIKNVRFGTYNFTKTSDAGEWNYTVGIDAIQAGGGRQRVWDIVINPKNGNFQRQSDYVSGHVYTGKIMPNEGRNATSEPIWIIGYFNDAHNSTLDDRIDFAIQVVNDNPPTVRPKAFFDCTTNKWKTTNREGGIIKIYDCVSGSWKDIKTINPGQPVSMNAGIFDCRTDKFVNMNQIGEK